MVVCGEERLVADQRHVTPFYGFEWIADPTGLSLADQYGYKSYGDLRDLFHTEDGRDHRCLDDLLFEALDSQNNAISSPLYDSVYFWDVWD